MPVRAPDSSAPSCPSWDFPTSSGWTCPTGCSHGHAGAACIGTLRNRVLGEPLDFPDNHFAGCVISGVFNRGHAPAASLDELVRVVRPGGVLTFNIGEQSWVADGFKAKLEELEAAGRGRLLSRSAPYRTMPLSVADGHFTAQAFAFAAI